DISSVQVLGQVLVILNSTTAARDLLEKKASIYSGRPIGHFFDMMNWSWNIVSTTYSAELRLRRKMLDRGMRPSAAVLYRPLQKDKVHHFLKQVLLKPKDFRKHVKHLQGAIMMSLVYGYDVQEENDSYVKTVLDVLEIAERALLPGSVLVNDIPFLKYLPEWLPGMGFKAVARVGEKLGQDMVNFPFDFVKDRIQQGVARPSVTRENLLELEQNHGVDPEEAERAIAEASGSVYPAGADTTRKSVSAISTLFLVLALYPEVQRRAQAELDAVTKGQRLPDFGDKPRLPYVEALWKEVLRWKSVAPVGVPHATTEDNVYDGYFIPKGAVVIAIYGARFLSWLDEDLASDILSHQGLRARPQSVRADPTLATVFGFGKRICPGRHIAEDTLFIVAAAILATFTIGKAKDAHGNEVPVECKYSGAVIIQANDFECSIVPRSKKAEELICMESWETDI
ncbi:cytochrome P450, partial [Artomyces pyxidatus]